MKIKAALMSGLLTIAGSGTIAMSQSAIAQTNLWQNANFKFEGSDTSLVKLKIYDLPRRVEGQTGSTIHGTLSIDSLRHLYFSGNKCAGKGMYRSYAEGTTVLVKNGQGNIIATGRLDRSQNETGLFTRRCTFFFQVDNIPESDFYTLVINGKSKTYSHQEMVNNNWGQIDFYLGNGY